MSGVDTVIFDFDGTLANSVDLMFDLYNSHVDEFGYLPIEREEFSALRRMGYAKAMRLKKVKARRLPKIALTLSREMHDRMDVVSPYEGIIEMLTKLKSKGLTIGVLTSNQASLVNEFFQKHSFPDFDFVVSEKTIFGKDKALKKIIKRFELDKSQVLYVGDEPRDVSASRKAKIKVIGVSWGLAGTEGFEKIKPDYLVDDPYQLEERILKLA
jgi:phosphoglycolate phosphatase-like HAD superfamily hydrolase